MLSGRWPIIPDGTAARHGRIKELVRQHAALALEARSDAAGTRTRLRELDAKMAVLAKLLTLCDVVAPQSGPRLTFGGAARTRAGRSGATGSSASTRSTRPRAGSARGRPRAGCPSGAGRATASGWSGPEAPSASRC